MNIKLKEKGKNILQNIKDRIPRLKLNKIRRADRIKLAGETKDLLLDRADNHLIKRDPVKMYPGKITIPWYHFYKMNRFKRIAGITTGVLGYALKLVPEYEIIGTIIQDAGVALGIFGYGHSLKKNYEKEGDTYVDKIKFFKKIAEAIIKIIKLFTKK